MVFMVEQKQYPAMLFVLWTGAKARPWSAAGAPGARQRSQNVPTSAALRSSAHGLYGTLEHKPLIQGAARAAAGGERSVTVLTIQQPFVSPIGK
jgi:hypothetical protein